MHSEADRDLVILKSQQMELEEIGREIEENKKASDDNLKKADELIRGADDLLERLGMSKNICIPKKEIKIPLEETFISPLAADYTYDELYLRAEKNLLSKGIDIYNLNQADLLDEDVINRIEYELNKPLDRREKWTKDDKIIVFAAAIVGIATDFFFGNRDNPLTGKNSKFAEHLDKLHVHPGGSPIDYQGEGFGGGDHRVLSKGHDLLRIVEAIWQIKNGTFVGIRHEYGKAIKVVSRVNQYGNPYEQMSTIEAIANYFKHMTGDFFSKNSIPIPGYSFFMESSNRELRVFAATMYKQGFNLKNVAIQGISTLAVELMLRIYMAIKETKRLLKEDKSLNILEDFSNFENIKTIINPAANSKYREMFLVTHAVITAVNIGKVIIKKAPWEINLTEIFMTIRYLVPYIKEVLDRHSRQAILSRNTQEIISDWDKLLENVESRKLEIPMPRNELVFE